MTPEEGISLAKNLHDLRVEVERLKTHRFRLLQLVEDLRGRLEQPISPFEAQVRDEIAQERKRAAEGTHKGMNRQDAARAIVDEVSRATGVSTEEIMGKSRKRSPSRARHKAVFLIREHLKFSYNELGDFFGSRNHRTMMNSVEKGALL